MRLKINSSEHWLQTVLGDFDSFLLDHAACERKASATALSLALHYPDRKDLVKAMVELSLEELEHFKQVYEVIEKRGLVLSPDTKDHYVKRLTQLIRSGPQDYFLDRLLIAGVIEARGTERFHRVAEALKDEGLKNFYLELTRAEARHHHLFLKLAKHYFSEEEVEKRLDELLTLEAKIIEEVPVRAAVH